MPKTLRRPEHFTLTGKTSGKKRVSERSIADRDRLILQWRYLPHHVVERVAPKGLRKVDYEEAEEQGFLALIRAAETWRDNGGAAFNTYCFRSIALWVARHLRHRGLIHVPENALREQAKKWSKECCKKASRFCTLPEGFDIPKAEEREQVDFDEVELLQAALAELSDRERMIVVGYVGEGRTLLSLGKELNISRERVRQIKDEALCRLRAKHYCPCPSEITLVSSLKRGSGRTPTVFVTFNGERRSIADWSAVLNIPKNTLWSRWGRGLSPACILAVPMQKMG